MNRPRKLYINENWQEFTEKVKQRDEYKCLQCGRSAFEVVLQVHHAIYIRGKSPWEYPLSDCRTLCKGCHAKEHKLVEPAWGWTLISIDDLGSLSGICELKGCGNEIRYEHLTYHPDWGYKIVGSTCIEHLTQEDRLLSSNVIKAYKNISNFVHKSYWESGVTKTGKKYISCKHNHHSIRIYGDNTNYSFQIILKKKGVRQHDFGNFIPAKNKSFEEVKELAYIVLKGTISDDGNEKVLLRNLYRKIR